jgi:ABC-type antimicrobial peptide transport system permease subunit
MSPAVSATLRSGRVVIGLGLVLFLGMCALLAPLIAPHDPAEQNLLSILLPPAWARTETKRFRLAPTVSAAASSPA